MKIIFFIPSLKGGGAERVVSILANEMAKRGNDITIVMTNNDCCDYSLLSNIKLKRLDNNIRLTTINRVMLRLKNIRNIVHFSKPDVVISFMSNTNIDVCLSLLGSNIPIIVSERNDPKVDPSNKVKRMMRKILYRNISGFVFQTIEAQEYFGKKIQQRSKIILNPVIQNLPNPYYGERELKIVSVGRLEKQKNYPLLLEAFALLKDEYPNYKLEIYGTGGMENSIKQKINQLKIESHVKLCGFHKDVHEKIKKASMFVMSSDFEGMPNALIEAMALGLPCISTDCPCGGPKTLINGYKNGILVPVNDTRKLYEAMKLLIENQEVAATMGQKAIKIREKTNASTVTEEWLSFIKRVIDNDKL